MMVVLGQLSLGEFARCYGYQVSLVLTVVFPSLSRKPTNIPERSVPGIIHQLQLHRGTRQNHDTYIHTSSPESTNEFRVQRQKQASDDAVGHVVDRPAAATLLFAICNIFPTLQ